MKLIVNGESHDHKGNGTLPALIAEAGADPERVAIMVNGDVVRRKEFEFLRLNEGDAVEILTFAGGG